MSDVLFLADRVPSPLDRADAARGYHILRHIAATNRVHVIAFADDPRDLSRKDWLAKLARSRTVIWRRKPYPLAAVEALARNRPVALTAFGDRTMREAVERLLNRHPIDLIYVASSRMAQYLPDQVRSRVVIDFADVDLVDVEATAATARGLRRWMARREGLLLGHYERGIARRADTSLLASADDAADFAARTGAEPIAVLENGVDFGFLNPRADFRRLDSPRALIVLTGRMDDPVNVEAATWFAEAVMPHIRLARPDVRFAIVGGSPAPAVSALANGSDIVVTGEVADLRGWLDAASVVVAPARVARRVQGNVLKAMAMACPVVASTAVASTVDHAGTIRVAATVGEMADGIVALIADPAGAQALGQAARDRVVQRYGWDACLRALDPILAAAERHRRAPIPHAAPARAAKPHAAPRPISRARAQ